MSSVGQKIRPADSLASMLNIVVTRVDPDKVQRLKAWMAEVSARETEARATLANEGVRHERAILVESSDGPLLVYAIECEDWDAAVSAFQKSDRPLDVEHQQVMAEVRGTPVPFAELLDLRL